MNKTRVMLVDNSSDRIYEKNDEGVWSKVLKPDPSGRRPRKHVERHTASQLNQLLLNMAITESVETPKESPRSWNKLFNLKKDKWLYLNLVQSRDDPDGIAIFHKDHNPIGTISVDWLKHLIGRLILYLNQYIRWKEWEKKQNQRDANQEEDY